MGKNGASVTGENMRTVKLSCAQSGESREVKIEGKKIGKDIPSLLQSSNTYLLK